MLAVEGHRRPQARRQGEVQTGPPARKKRPSSCKQAAERKNSQPHEDAETVGQHLDHWLNDIAKPNTRANTWDRYEQVVHGLHLRPRVGGVPLRKLTVAGVTNLWAEMSRDKISAGNIKKCSEVLASCSGMCGFRTQDPRRADGERGQAESHRRRSRGVHRRRGESHPGSITRRAARSRCTRSRSVPARVRGKSSPWSWPTSTLRPARCEFRRCWTSRDGGEFVLQPPKSKSGLRTIRLPGFVLDAVKTHLKGREPGPVFTTKNGTYLAKSSFVRSYLETARESREGANTENFTPFVTPTPHAFWPMGSTPAEVAKRLGDKIETVMRIYAHWIPSGGKDTADRVDAIYGEKGESPWLSGRGA